MLLIRPAVRKRDLALERGGEREADPALDLRLERVGVDHEARIDRAEYAIDREPVVDAPQLHHFRHIGLEASAAADIAIVRNAAKRIGGWRRAPSGSLRCGVEHAQ